MFEYDSQSEISNNETGEGGEVGTKEWFNVGLDEGKNEGWLVKFLEATLGVIEGLSIKIDGELVCVGLEDGTEDSSTEGELDDKTDGDIDCCNVG